MIHSPAVDPGLGRLGEVAAWWAGAGAGGRGGPRRARLVLVGDDPRPDDPRPDDPRPDDRRPEDRPLEALAEVAGVGLRRVVAPATDATEHEHELSAAAADAAVRYGRDVVDEEVDGGADLILVAEASPAGSAVTVAAAAAVAAMTGREPTAVVGVPPGPGGRPDDEAWMRRVPAVRDRLRRARPAGRDPLALLARLGDRDLAALVGVLAQAAHRRTPVVLDGLVCTAAALLAEPLEPDARDRWLAATRCPDPAAGYALDVLGLDPLLDLGLWTGRGTGALTAVTVVRAALAAAAASA